MTASIWAPNGFSPEVIPFAFFEGVATAGQTNISIAPYTALLDSQLQVFVAGQLQNTALWNIVGTEVILTTPMTLGQSYRVDIYAASPVVEEELPSQAGNAGKALFTDGTNPLWADIPVELPSQFGQGGKGLFTDGNNPFWGDIPNPIPSQAGNARKYLSTNGTNTRWQSFPVYNPLDYGITFDGVTDDTAAWISLFGVIHSAGGGTVIMPPGTTSVSSIVYNWNNSIPVNLIGQGKGVTRFVKRVGTATPILDFSSSAINLEVDALFKGFDLIGNSRTNPGIRLTNMARFGLEDLGIEFNSVGIENLGSLVFYIKNCSVQGNSIGYRSRKSSSVYCNLITIQGGEFNGNPVFGLDIGDCAGLLLQSVDIEGNGIAGDLSTGGVIIRSTCDDETGYSHIHFNNVWTEANFGRNIDVESCAGLNLNFTNTLLTGNEGGRALRTSLLSSVTLNNCQATSAALSDTVTLAATRSVIIGGVYQFISDSSTHKVYIATSTSTTNYPFYVNTIDALLQGITRLDPSHKFTGGLTPFSDGAEILTIQNRTLTGNIARFFATNGAQGNGANCALNLGTSSVTGRSLNSGGTNNASGADYAEYVYKREDCGLIEKGGIVGFDSTGKITDKWSNAVTFGIKSTNPSFVGGDNWHLNLEENANAEALEAERVKVDRIAFCGLVPIKTAETCEVGDYVIPVSTETDGIAYSFTSTPTFDEYRKCIGIIRSKTEEGVPIVSVKVS